MSNRQSSSALEPDVPPPAFSLQPATPAARPPDHLPNASALSLASYQRNGGSVALPEGWVSSGCERRLTEVRDAVSGRVYLAGCGAWSCPVCGPRRARLLSEVIAWTRPTTFGRLSLMPEDFASTRGQMRDLRRRLSDRFGSVEWAWVRHRNPKLTGYHVHFLGRMPWIPQRELQAMTGGRIPWISAARQELGSSDYLMGVRKREGASGYLLKRAARPEFWQEHMALNNGRGAHWSREFFLDPDSGEVLGVAEATARVKALRSSGGIWYHPGSPSIPDWRKGQYQDSGFSQPLAVDSVRGSVQNPQRSMFD